MNELVFGRVSVIIPIVLKTFKKKDSPGHQSESEIVLSKRSVIA